VSTAASSTAASAPLPDVGPADLPAVPAPARSGSALLTDLVVLVRDTLRVGVRLFPQILTLWLLGWLGSTLALQVAGRVADVSGWAALAVFSFSFLSTLTAIVLILRLCGQELGIRALIPRGEAADDDRDTSLTRLLAVTLLPFLGLYAAFGQVEDRAALLQTDQIFRNSVFGPSTVLQTVRGFATAHPWEMLLLLVAVYAVRRAVDTAHEKTGWRPLGLVVALIESFFLLVVIFGGFTVANRVHSWLATRAFMAWFDGIGAAVRAVLAAIHASLPAALDRLVGFVSDELGPLLWTVLSEPVIWLAVAALVYGSQVLSFAELWRKGQPLARRLPGASVFDRRAERRAMRPLPPAGIRRAGVEVKEAFLGDLDDKYLPTFHSLRLVLRAGVVFFAAYVLVYNALAVARHSVIRLYELVLGGHDTSFWYLWGPYLDLLENLPWELLRICLLAVAFRRCLELFQQRGRALAAAVPDGPATPAVVG
jgi:hypothetical protein